MLTTEFWKKYFKVYDVLNLCIPYQELVADLIKELDPRPGEKILDAGGGTGNVAAKLADMGAEVTVLDFSKEALEICQKKDSRIKTVFGDLKQKLPFPDGYFNKAVSNNAIYTISPEKRPALFSEIYRVLTPTGRFIVSNVTAGFQPMKIYKDHVRKAVKKDGFLKTVKSALQMFWPTIKMFYYNGQIKKENKTGSYAFFKEGEQRELLEKAGFKIINETKAVYAGQGVMDGGEK